ncbi:DAHL domain-containing protein [Magnetospirillum gryphiswaldense]|uniref:histidine kinase n=1 Tax=Magnetospirillum gryphiswaldense TaxID=55518 RepID=A4TW03_9PROT|nr:DAHL domain-containing protein [Magnetospirillum gryphiswaldense]AVM76258.1 Phytochrome-like protein cph1 [Magnetospirillum gryphiswaldense MSR-1]AVM80161.1 Phytochrome-like protein cph1 [Magnetospirillum gryphiswaldense]CAM74810.1 Signal transduction histidine kinase [Magnetospirillum gryphiswaldense MSR-1]
MRTLLRPAVLAFAAAAAMAGVMIVFAARNTVDSERHAQVVTSFDTQSRIEANFDRDLLQVVAGLLPHYDTMLAYERQLRDGLDALEAGNPHGDIPAGQLALYRQHVTDKMQAAEQIKAVSAFVRREISYLPFAVTGFAAHAAPDTARRVQAALIALDTESRGDTSQSAGLTIEIERFAASPDEELRSIALHMRTLSEQQDMLRQAIDTYFAIPSQTTMEAARHDYMAAFAIRQDRTATLSRLLQISTVLLFVALGWAIHRQAKAHDATLVARAQLIDAVTSLSEAFALFDNKRHLVLSNHGYDHLLDTPAPIGTFDQLMRTMGTRLEAVNRPVIPTDTDHAQELLLRDRQTGRWYLFRSRQTSAGGLVCLFTDLTDDKRNEIELRKLTAAVEQSPVAVVITDADAAIEYVNPAFLALTGYTLADVIGKNPRLLKSGEVDIATYREMWKTLSSGLTWRGDLVNRKKNGELFWESTVISPVRDHAGRITHYIALKEDITQQKRNADLLLDANADIERMLFATSHDLQEPVRSIQIYCQKLEREIPAELGAAARDSMRTIADGARQISLLVSGLSAYSRSGRPMAAFVPVDCAKAAEAAWSECKNTLGAPPILGVHWTTLPVISGDPVLLVMLFHNLFANAIKFARPAVAAKITVNAERDGSGWRIDVTDNGIGIEAAYLDKVTKPFARLHPRAQYPGAGMGLASCDKIAKAHGGRLWLDSIPGQGTTVHVWLPAAENA